MKAAPALAGATFLFGDTAIVEKIFPREFHFTGVKYGYPDGVAVDQAVSRVTCGFAAPPRDVSPKEAQNETNHTCHDGRRSAA